MVFIDCVWYISNCWVIAMNIGNRDTKWLWPITA